MKRFIIALLVGVGLFAQSASAAMEHYWVVMHTNNFLTAIDQWGYKLHKEKADCEKYLIERAMKSDGYLVQKSVTGVWAYTDSFVGNTDVPYAYMKCVTFRYDPKGSKQGFYD